MLINLSPALSTGVVGVYSDSLEIPVLKESLFHFQVFRMKTVFNSLAYFTNSLSLSHLTLVVVYFACVSCSFLWKSKFSSLSSVANLTPGKWQKPTLPEPDAAVAVSEVEAQSPTQDKPTACSCGLCGSMTWVAPFAPFFFCVSLFFLIHVASRIRRVGLWIAWADRK